jgi:hypothetical protein
MLHSIRECFHESFAPQIEHTSDGIGHVTTNSIADHTRHEVEAVPIAHVHVSRPSRPLPLLRVLLAPMITTSPHERLGFGIGAITCGWVDPEGGRHHVHLLAAVAIAAS